MVPVERGQNQNKYLFDEFRGLRHVPMWSILEGWRLAMYRFVIRLKERYRDCSRTWSDGDRSSRKPAAIVGTSVMERKEFVNCYGL